DVEIGIFGAAAKGCLSELEKTLKDNDINALNSSRETLLHVAATNGHLAIMEYLISKGAKPDVKDKKGRTPLHRAAEKGDKTMVEMLLNANADPNAQDKEKRTPLHAAAERGHLSVVRVLLATKGRLGSRGAARPPPFLAGLGGRGVQEGIWGPLRGVRGGGTGLWGVGGGLRFGGGVRA
uniref:Uncharacterized protein n=1 Tax=Anser brachyrhynchus TaxID=132585 RepID=A0A8B9CZ54_9AVES